MSLDNKKLYDQTLLDHLQENAYQEGKKDQKKSMVLICVIFVVLFTFLGGVAGAGIYTYLLKQHGSGISELTKEIYQYLVDEWLYSGDIEDVDKYINNLMISGMMDGDGDPYTFYTPTYEGQGLDTSGSGKYGVSTTYYTASVSGTTYGGLKIISLEDGNFKNDGFLVGDVIVAAHSKDETEFTYFDDKSPAEIDSLMLPHDEKKDDKVYFKLIRNEKFYEISSSLGSYTQTPVTFLKEGKDGNDKHYLALKVSTFLGDSNSGYPYDQMKYYIDNSLSKSGAIDNLILDLRNNGGGYTDQAYKMACLFLEKNMIVYQEGGKSGEIEKTYYQNNNPHFSREQVKNIKIILNSSSASASELFTKALKDNDLCETYGETSFGKGIAQSVINLTNGGTLRITTSKIYGPKGDSIHKIGIVPDHQTNNYKYYVSHLVGTPYIKDSYRLTYEQEQNVIQSLKNFLPEERVPSYSQGLSNFQSSLGLEQSGEYDCRTLFRVYKENMERYYLAFNQELADIYLGNV